MNDLYNFDNEYRLENDVICGVDEAGRGPLAGPVCCAAVILNPDDIIDGVMDSKKISEKKRDFLYDEIIKRAVDYKIIFVDERKIDEINILNATMLGMNLAISGLKNKPNLALIDGNKCPEDCEINCISVVKGDFKSASIAAASILAKVTRDRYMKELAIKYPDYALDKHKGYGTKLHYEMIAKYGIQSFHRKSFLKKYCEIKYGTKQKNWYFR